MGLLRRVEDRPAPQEIYNWRLWALAFLASFASIMIGHDSAFVGGTLALPSFIKSFGKLNASVSANLVSTYQAGAFLGSFVGHPLGHFMGRKRGLTVAATVFTIGAAIIVNNHPYFVEEFNQIGVAIEKTNQSIWRHNSDAPWERKLFHYLHLHQRASAQGLGPFVPFHVTPSCLTNEPRNLDHPCATRPIAEAHLCLGPYVRTR